MTSIGKNRCAARRAVGHISILHRVEDYFSAYLISFDDAVRFSGVAQRHGSIDDCADFSLARGVERLLDIGNACSGSADDAKPAHVEALYVECHRAAAVGACCDQPPVHGQACKSYRPERRVGDIFTNYIHPFIVGEPHDLLRQITRAIIDPKIGAVTFREIDSLVGSRSGDYLGAEHFGELHTRAAERARCAHDQHPFTRPDFGFIDEKIEGHRKVSRDDRSLRKGDVVGKLYSEAFRHGDILRVTAPAIDSDSLAVHATRLIAFQTWAAPLTRYRRDYSDAITNHELRGPSAEFNDFTGRVDAEHMGKLNFYGVVAGADNAIEGSVDRNRVDSYENFADIGLEGRQIFQV
jgi:hypothetical protein